MTAHAAPLLALDSGSPVVSLALGLPGGEIESRTLQLRRSSEQLLPAVHDMLRSRGLGIGDVGGLVALGGPGSFTGLRVGLATILGLHQALGLRARALPTLPILARSARGELRDGDQLIAVVDALRGEWMSQTFVLEGGEPQAVESPLLRDQAELTRLGRPVVGFELGALADHLGAEKLLDAQPLAPIALEPALDGEWDAGTLVEPIYFRPPATTKKP